MSEQPLIRKINCRLPEFEMLHKARPHEQGDLGTYYVVDHYLNIVQDRHIEDLDDYLAPLVP